MVTPTTGDAALVSAATLDRLAQVAQAAGESIRAHYDRGSVEVSRKGDQSPLTDADRDAHAIILAALAEWHPEIPVISEEGELPAPEVRRSWRRFWLVDPLDGTKEFLQRNGEFTVNIALVEGEVPVLGVIHAPALGVTYTAGEGLGAWRREADGTAVRIHSTRPPQGQPLRVVESRSHPSPELEAWLQSVPVAERVGVGSSLKFCRVAEGCADVYPRLGPTMEWDVAAGDCIYRNSGLPAPRSSPLRYNQPDLRIPGFILGLEA